MRHGILRQDRGRQPHQDLGHRRDAPTAVVVEAVEEGERAERGEDVLGLPRP
jgi:hypothetical protein